MWGHTWSLAVEEHFYIVLPLVLIALNRLSRMSILPYIAVALITVCLILRLAVSLNSDNMEAVLFPTSLRVDALFAGVTLGYFFIFAVENSRP